MKQPQPFLSAIIGGPACGWLPQSCSAVPSVSFCYFFSPVFNLHPRACLVAQAPKSLDQPVIMTSPHSLFWHHLWFHTFLSLVIVIMVPAYSLLPDSHLLGLGALIPAGKAAEATATYIGLELWDFRLLVFKLNPKLTANKMATHTMSKLKRKSLQDLLSSV